MWLYLFRDDTLYFAAVLKESKKLRESSWECQPGVLLDSICSSLSCLLWKAICLFFLFSSGKWGTNSTNGSWVYLVIGVVLKSWIKNAMEAMEASFLPTGLWAVSFYITFSIFSVWRGKKWYVSISGRWSGKMENDFHLKELTKDVSKDGTIMLD